MHTRLRTFARGVALIGVAALGGCSGGGGSGSSSGSIAVENISIQPGALWQINREIEFTFSQPVDFGSVNLNTINIAKVGGATAVGEFTQPMDAAGNVIAPNVVLFQPACPTQPDFSDAGLLPSSTYVINVVGSQSGGATVLSTGGAGLTQGQTITFTTPSSSLSSNLFIDDHLGPALPIPPNGQTSSYLELGEDPENRVYFVPGTDPNIPGDTAPAGFEAPLNLYSDVGTRVSIVVQLNQAVNPSGDNINAETIRMEYCESGCETPTPLWKRVPHDVELTANCTTTGATVRVSPLGILPQGRKVRVVLTSELHDLIDQFNIVDVPVGSFVVDTVGEESDEVLEEFSSGAGSTESLEDLTAVFSEPKAVWGNDKLEAAFAFDGTGGEASTGGQGGIFDWTVAQDTILNTTFSVITSADQQFQQTIINGKVDVRNFKVNAGIDLVLQGPNPCTILASGTVEIQGKILVRGTNNKGVATLNTTNIPELGAAGNCGGGRGGTASFLTTQSTPQGEPGYGAFNVAGGGGGGGESSYNSLANDNKRRPGGGGGGALGTDALRPSGGPGAQANNGFVVPNPNGCPDQTVIGLDLEKGFPGWPLTQIETGAGAGPTGNNGALHPGQQPLGGSKGARPFFDGNDTNDFWGTMVTLAGTLIQGELLQPWAGAGGGAGGNAVFSSSFPQTPFTITGDEKGAGGGGGAGSLTILALKAITFGPAGRIDAKGGTGGGGENSGAGGVTRVGGGSGGGSGGHVVLQSATKIDFSLCKSAAPNNGGIYAVGGQGGAGAEDDGGAKANGVQTSAQLDALPPNAYPTQTINQIQPGPCPMTTGIGYAFTNTVGNPTPVVNGNPPTQVHNFVNANDPNTVVAGAGGDGGPGIIQLHTPSLTDIVAPTGVENFYKILKPYPLGAPANSINTLSTWDHMLPIFGRRSIAQSKWIPLGLANVVPGSSTPQAVQLVFHGTDASGLIEKDPATSGDNQLVLELPPIFSGPVTSIGADERTAILSAAGVDQIYKDNALLMRRFSLALTHAGLTNKFEVSSASYDASADQFLVTVSASGMPLQAYEPGDPAELRPRFFRVSTDGVLDSLPDSSTIQIEFQATSENPQAAPNQVIGPEGATDWESDIQAINSHPNAANFRFLRFRVTFDILADGSSLDFSTPIPALEFFRVPFKF